MEELDEEEFKQVLKEKAKKQAQTQSNPAPSPRKRGYTSGTVPKMPNVTTGNVTGGLKPVSATPVLGDRGMKNISDKVFGRTKKRRRSGRSQPSEKELEDAVKKLKRLKRLEEEKNGGI